MWVRTSTMKKKRCVISCGWCLVLVEVVNVDQLYHIILIIMIIFRGRVNYAFHSSSERWWEHDGVKHLILKSHEATHIHSLTSQVTFTYQSVFGIYNFYLAQDGSYHVQILSNLIKNQVDNNDKIIILYEWWWILLYTCEISFCILMFPTLIRLSFPVIQDSRRTNKSPVSSLILMENREFHCLIHWLNNNIIILYYRSEDGSSGKKLAHSGLGSPDDSSSGESQDEKPSMIDSTGFLSHHHHHHQLGLNHQNQKSSPSSLNIFSQHQMVNLTIFQRVVTC